jgi:hypothetical protein
MATEKFEMFKHKSNKTGVQLVCWNLETDEKYQRSK